MPSKCPGTLVWFDAGYAAILECSNCGYIVVTGSFLDEAHAECSVLREGWSS